MESGNLEWQMKVLDPKAVIEEAIAATAGLFPQGGDVVLQSELSNSLPAVYVDADRLTQVLINLISNAAKFCDPDEGAVWITAQAEDGDLKVSVRDNGVGIDPSDHEKIFQRFQQVGNQMSGKPRGSGLGLPICTEIINQFGGEIWVDSQLEQGATFSFRIPAAAGAGTTNDGVSL
jgi:signal transduction histidine kinase